jgi:hypothetical protein
VGECISRTSTSTSTDNLLSLNVERWTLKLSAPGKRPLLRRAGSLPCPVFIDDTVFCLDVTAFRLGVAGFSLSVTGFPLDVSAFGLGVTGFGLGVTCFCLGVTGFGLGVTAGSLCEAELP